MFSGLERVEEDDDDDEEVVEEEDVEDESWEPVGACVAFSSGATDT